MTTAPTTLVPTPPSTEIGVIGCVGIAVGLLLSCARAWIWSQGDVTSEAFGYAFSGIAVAGLVGYLFAGRRKVRKPNQFGLWFFIVSLVIFLLELSSHSRH
jgi:hypothetical protein